MSQSINEWRITISVAGVDDPITFYRRRDPQNEDNWSPAWWLDKFNTDGYIQVAPGKFIPWHAVMEITFL